MKMNLLLIFLTGIFVNFRQIQIFAKDEILNLWPLTFFCWIPLFQILINIHKEGLMSAQLAVGLALGIAGFKFAPEGSWFYVLPMFVVGFFIGGLFALFARTIPRESVAGKIFLLAAGYTAICYLMTNLVGDYLLVAVGLAEIPWLLQPLSFLGHSAIEFLIAFTAASLGMTRKPVLMTASVIWIVWLILSVSLYSISISGVQINVATVSGLSESREFNALLKTAELAETDILVFPEYFLSGNESNCKTQIEKLAKNLTSKNHPILVLGCGSLQWQVNLAYTIHRQRIIAEYAKLHPVWLIGEKNSVNKGLQVVKVVTPKTKRLVNLGILICYDMDFPSTVTKLRKAGSQIILNPSDDWSQVRTRWQTAVYRAIENRIPVVKADSQWDSVIVDLQGNVLAKFESFQGLKEPKFLTASVSIASPSNLTIGADTIPVICFAFVAAHLLDKRSFDRTPDNHRGEV